MARPYQDRLTAYCQVLCACGQPPDGSTTQPPDESAICRSGSALDIFDASGHVDPTRYRAVAAAFATEPFFTSNTNVP